MAAFWSSKERLVKPVSAGLKGVGKDGKLREDELTPMVSFLAAGRGLQVTTINHHLCGLLQLWVSFIVF